MVGGAARNHRGWFPESLRTKPREVVLTGLRRVWAPVRSTPMTIIIGIDPGVSGALAALEFGRKGVSRVLDVIDMPTMPGIKKRRIADAHGITDWLEGFAPDLTADDWACVVEEVHSMPRDGAVGAFAFAFRAVPQTHAPGSGFVKTLIWVEFGIKPPTLLS